MKNYKSNINYKEIGLIILVLLAVSYCGRLFKMMDTPKLVEKGLKTPVVMAQEPSITPTPSPQDFIDYVNEKFGNEAYKAFTILHGTKYCGGENGKHDPEAHNKNNDPEKTNDWGYWQFNDKWHPEVTLECAKDIKCSTDRAYEIYKHDGSFKQWSAGKCIGL